MPGKSTNPERVLRDPRLIGGREIAVWVKLLKPLVRLLESIGGTLEVAAVFPDHRIAVWPPPKLEPSEAIMEPPGSLDARERGEPQSTTVVAPGENQCQRSAATLSGQSEEPYLSTSEILKMWREASQSRT